MGKMKIIQLTSQPENSIILNNWSGDIHYIDSYQVNISNPNDFTIDDFASKILDSDSPKWEKALIYIRESVAGLFKFKTGMTSKSQKKHIKPTQYTPGDKIGVFPVVDRSESEIVMALDDKHLSFRVSLLLRNIPESFQHSIFMTTIVQYHNILGRLYFFPVKPFHKIIVKQSLNRFSKQYAEIN